MANRYWIGNSGSWTDTAHWSSQSGGTGGASVPGLSDLAIFDSNSFNTASQTVTLDAATTLCGGLDASAATNSPTFTGSNPLICNGSLVLCSGLTWNHTGSLSIDTSTSCNINTLGKTISSLTLGNNNETDESKTFNISSALVVTGVFEHDEGTINTNGNAITCGRYYAYGGYGTKSLNLGASVFTCTDSYGWVPDASAAGKWTISAGTSTIKLTNTTSAHFYGMGQTYYRVEFSGNTDFDSTSNTFYSLKLPAGKTITFTANITQNIKFFGMIGTSGNVITIKSSVDGTQFTLAKSFSGNWMGNYCSFRDCNVSGGGIVSFNSTLVSNNTNVSLDAGSFPSGRYWIGDYGSWEDTIHWAESSCGACGAAVPNSADNVYFDANSFTQTGQYLYLAMPTSNCKNMDWTGVQYNPGFNDNARTLAIYGSLKLATGMTVTSTGTWTFVGSGTKTISTFGKAINIITLNSAASLWTLQSDFAAITSIETMGGAGSRLTTDGYAISAPSIKLATIQIYLGSSTITCSDTLTITSVTFNSGTSKIIMNKPSGVGTLACTGKTLYDVELQKSCIINGANTYHDIKINAGCILYFLHDTTQTITTISGNGTYNAPITISSNYTGYANVTISCSDAIVKDYCMVESITYSGSGSFTVPNGQVNNCTNITLQNTFTGLDRYWVGGSGNWSDNTNHWSGISGGLPGAVLPTQYENVRFDANSFTAPSQTVTLTAIANCCDMNWTGATNSPTFNKNGYKLQLYGSLTFISDMTVTGAGGYYWGSTVAGRTITSAGKSMIGDILCYISGYQGTYTLQDNLVCTGNFSFSGGTLNTNNNNMTFSGTFTNTSTFARIFNLGSSIITASQFTFGANDVSAQFNVGTSTFVQTGTNAFTGGGNTFYNVEFRDSCTISGANTFNDLKLFAGKTYTFTAGVTQTVASMSGNGTYNTPLTLTSSSTTPFTILTGATINIDYYKISYCTKSGSGSITVANGQSITGNTGITFTNTFTWSNRYWVGNGGSWSDINHWSGISGGTGGAPVPTSSNNVYFDASSFSINSTVNTGLGTCNGLDTTGVTGTQAFSGTGINVYGSINITDNVTVTGAITLYGASTGKTVSINNAVNGGIGFNAVGGEWTISRNITSSGGNISVSAGTVNFGSVTVNCVSFIISGSSTRTVNLGSCNIYAAAVVATTTTSLTFSAGTSTIYLTNTSSNFSGGGLYYSKVVFQDNCTIAGANTFNELQLTAGKSYSFPASTTQTVATLSGDGSQASPIYLYSATAGTRATISKASGTVTKTGYKLKDINTTGGAGWNFEKSVNSGNNIGMAFRSWNPNIDGTYKNTSRNYVNIGGVWKEVSAIYANVDGVWKLV